VWAAYGILSLGLGVALDLTAIVPVTQAAHAMVMFQMLGDLVLVGIVARVIVGAVQPGLRRHQPGTQPH
jgi:hypothetical protein